MTTSNKTPVGEVRPSQLLWTYGPGALIDLPSLSVVTLGIDRWEKDRCQPLMSFLHPHAYFWLQLKKHRGKRQ